MIKAFLHIHPTRNGSEWREKRVMRGISSDECPVISILLSLVLKSIVILVSLGVFPAFLVTDGCTFHQETSLFGGSTFRGFEPEGPFVVYNDKNIFEYMNGEADIYLNAGFQQLHTRIYRRKANGAMMRVEVFDMKGPGAVLKVFEILAKGGGNKIQGLGESGWQYDWVLFFRRGSNLYRIQPHYSGPSKAKTEPKDVLEFARILDRTLLSSGPNQ